MEYPYQLVTFFDKEPAIGEFVYQGENGWYPQVALKRRFAFVGLSEEQGLAKIESFLAGVTPFEIHFGERVQPKDMPVEVIEVVDSAQLMAFHHDLIRALGDAIVSRFPERDGANYHPHMTITWKGQDVVTTEEFARSTRLIAKVWVLKDDGPAEDSKAYKTFRLE